MHPQARDFVARTCHPRDVCEFGSYDVNGSIRDLFPGCNYLGVDVRTGPGVDVVADCAEWDGGGRTFDVIVCCEVLEHCRHWRDIILNAASLLRHGGRLIITAAGPQRPAHTCNGLPWSEASGEYYCNIDPEELKDCLAKCFTNVWVECTGQDVRALAIQPQMSTSSPRIVKIEK